MKKIVIALALIGMVVPASAQTKGEVENEPAGGGVTVTLTDGPVTLTINSFGRVGQTIFGTSFGVGEPNQLFEHTDYYSDGGPVASIASTNPSCSIVTAIAADSATHATSAVQCGACVFNFDQNVSATGPSSGVWNTTVNVIGCNLACYYAYQDYDIHNFANNESAWHPGEGGFLGQFVVHNQVIGPDVHYLFTDKSGAAHREQDNYQVVQNRIVQFHADGYGTQSCRDLFDTFDVFRAISGTMVNGDFTSALQYSISPPAPAVISYSSGRDDSIPIP